MVAITLENICDICEKEGCDEPCGKWYDCFEGKPVTFGFVDEGDEDEKNLDISCDSYMLYSRRIDGGRSVFLDCWGSCVERVCRNKTYS